MARGAVILIENDRVALIERVRQGRTYYLFPGGTREPGETAEQAAVREAKEELGLDVRLGRLVAIVEFDGNRQDYFLAETIGGIFGTGDGAEYDSLPTSEVGSYCPVWIDCGDLANYDVRPRVLAEAVRSGSVLALRQPLQIQE
jgi:8-oxo-dGTP pyrophosphatase MutT (NUDIX family)